MNKISIIALAMALVLLPMNVQGKKKTDKKLPQKEMLLQLYSIREVMGDAASYAQKHVQVFKQLKDMGFTGMEAANYGDGKFYGVSPEQYKKDLEDAGLKPVSSHATYWLSEQEMTNHDFTKAMAWWEQAIAAHKAAGMKYIVSPSMRMPNNAKDAQTLCDYHNAIGEKCRAAGLLYGFHTHSGEYQNIPGTSTPWIQYMMEHISPDNMFWQMDVYWCVMAQQSPVYWFKKYPGRFKMLHIKDKYEVGASGMVNYEAIFNNAATAGLQDYVVELEGTDGTIDIMEGVRRSVNYLRAAPYVKASYHSK